MAGRSLHGWRGGSARALVLLLLCAVPTWMSLAVLLLDSHDREAASRSLAVLSAAREMAQRHDAAATLPARRHGSPSPAAVAAGGDPDLFADLAAKAGWAAAVQDEHGSAIQEGPGMEHLRGEPLTAVARALAAGQQEGLLHARTGQGVPVLLAFARLRTAASAAVVAVPEHTLLDDWWRWFRSAAGVIGSLMALGTGGAAWLARQLAAARRGLRHASTARAQADRLLDARTRERDAAVRAQAAAARELRRDPLTRLANRTAFLEALEAAIARQAASGGALTLLFVDVDDFKAVNDRWGHAAGDRLLCLFGARLVGGVRDADVSARLSGDEFAILLDGLTADGAEPIAQTLIGRLSQPYRVAAHQVALSASIGAASFPRDGRSAQALLRAADAAMYAAKAARKGSFQRYDTAVLASGRRPDTPPGRRGQAASVGEIGQAGLSRAKRGVAPSASS